MIPESDILQVTIFGEHYTIKTAESTQLVEEAAVLVDALMKEIAQNSSLDHKHIAVLAALRVMYQLKSYEPCHQTQKLVRYIESELNSLDLAC